MRTNSHNLRVKGLGINGSSRPSRLCCDGGYGPLNEPYQGHRGIALCGNVGRDGDENSMLVLTPTFLRNLKSFEPGGTEAARDIEHDFDRMRPRLGRLIEHSREE